MWFLTIRCYLCSSGQSVKVLFSWGKFSVFEADSISPKCAGSLSVFPFLSLVRQAGSAALLWRNELIGFLFMTTKVTEGETIRPLTSWGDLTTLSPSRAEKTIATTLQRSLKDGIF